MDKQLVSIIVPIYNGEKYLDSCLACVTGQTYENIEILLVNDGSTDNSLELCRQAAASDPRIKVIDKANGGVATARNAGIEAALGAYVTFVDVDDWVPDDMIESLYNAAVSNDACMVRGKAEIEISRNKKYVEGLHGLEGRNYGKNELAEVIPHFIAGDDAIMCLSGTLLVKKDKAVRFHDGLAYMEDSVFMIRQMLSCDRIYMLDKIVFKHYYYDESISHDTSRCERNMNAIADAVCEIREVLTKADLLGQELEGRICAKCLNLMFAKSKQMAGAAFGEYKRTFKKVFERSDVKDIVLHADKDGMSMVKKLQSFCIRHGMYFILTLITKITAMKG